MQTLNMSYMSYADCARHFQTYSSLLANEAVEVQTCLFLMSGAVFLIVQTAC